MKLSTLISVAPLALAFALTPAYAGSPDVPGAKGDKVTYSVDYWQDRTGDKSAFGKIVSGNASGKNPGSGRRLGEYLQNEVDGPNPANDNGGGND